jgi:hypothetical protein
MGSSATSYGIVGGTYDNAAAGSAGVWGTDASSSGTNNAGVLGGSIRGIGLKGITHSGTGAYGEATTGGTGVQGESNFGGVGVEGDSARGGFGVVGKFSGTDSGTAILARDLSSGPAALASFGLWAYSHAGTALFSETDSTSGSAFALRASAPYGSLIFFGTGEGGSVVQIDRAANITTTGLLSTAGSCSSGCVRHRRMQSYGTTAAAPTLEDAGEARLVAGAALVRLDPAFANGIDPQQGYLVMLTPEGDTRGLYVAQRTMTGFVVRETMSGRSSLAFAYRIVAHPYGVRVPRLPFVEAPVQNPTAPR